MQARKPATQAYLIHDRDSIFARRLDNSIKNLGMTLLRSPPHSVKANAISIPAIASAIAQVRRCPRAE